MIASFDTLPSPGKNPQPPINLTICNRGSLANSPSFSTLRSSIGSFVVKKESLFSQIVPSPRMDKADIIEDLPDVSGGTFRETQESARLMINLSHNNLITVNACDAQNEKFAAPTSGLEVRDRTTGQNTPDRGWKSNISKSTRRLTLAQNRTNYVGPSKVQPGPRYNLYQKEAHRSSRNFAILLNEIAEHPNERSTITPEEPQNLLAFKSEMKPMAPTEESPRKSVFIGVIDPLRCSPQENNFDRNSLNFEYPKLSLGPNKEARPLRRFTDLGLATLGLSAKNDQRKRSFSDLDPARLFCTPKETERINMCLAKLDETGISSLVAPRTSPRKLRKSQL